MNIIKELTSAEQRYRAVYGLTPTDKQRAIIESKDKFINSRFERGEGCTYACVIKAIEYAINNPESSVAIFSHANYGATYQYNTACRFFRDSKYLALSLYRRSSSVSKPFIDFTNGSRISFLGRPNDNVVRGRRLDCAIIDGSQYFNEEEIRSVGLCTASSYGQLIVIDQDDILE